MDRRAVGGKKQIDMGQRDPMVHDMKGDLAEERAMAGRGTTATQYRSLQNASHAHMKGGRVAGGAMTGGRPQLAGGMMCPSCMRMSGGAPSVSGGAMTGGRPQLAGGAPSVSGGMYTEMELKGLARAVGGQKAMSTKHSQMVEDIKGAGFMDDFKSMFMSDADEVGSVVGGKKKRKSAGPDDARRKRGAMVSKLMREKGMTLGEASKHIKTHGME